MLDCEPAIRGTSTLSRTVRASLTVRNITSASADGDTTLGATPPGDEPDRVVRAAEVGIGRQRDASQLDERIDQLVDRRFAQLGKRRVRRAPARHQPEPQGAARRQRQPVVGRLAVDEEPRTRRREVRRARAVAAALLADDEQQADALLAGAPQAVDGRDLRREDALRIARAAAEDASALEPARKKRRDAVEVRREDDLCVGRAGEDVEPAGVDRLLGDGEADAAAGNRRASGRRRASRPVVESMSTSARVSATRSTT